MSADALIALTVGWFVGFAAGAPAVIVGTVTERDWVFMSFLCAMIALILERIADLAATIRRKADG